MEAETGTDDGELERQGDRAVVRFTRRFPYTPQDVWPALTEPDHLVAWFPTTIEGRRESGAPLHFGFRDMEGPPFEGEMVRFDPPTVMELRWGDETLRFELRGRRGDGSLVGGRPVETGPPFLHRAFRSGGFDGGSTRGMGARPRLRRCSPDLMRPPRSRVRI